MHGEEPHDAEHASLHDYAGQPAGHGQIRPVQPPSHLAARGLSRQDTFDAETQGSRDSSYTEPGDSCMDIETDPYEESEPRGPRSLGHQRHHQRQGSWDAEEPDRQNHNRPLHGRGKGHERYCQNEEEALGHNRNNVEDWGRDVYIR